MIEIVGEGGSSEFRAAEKIREMFLELLVRDDSRIDLKIVVSAKMFGEKRQDVDLIVIGKLLRPVTIPKSTIVSKDAQLLSFFLVVEVKDHSPERIEFRGPKAFVSYQGRYEDASEQSHQQMMSARNYIDKSGLKPPFLVNLLLLNNCPSKILPTVRHNILGGDFSVQNFLEAIYMAYENNLNEKNILIQSFGQRNSASYLQISGLFARKVSPSKLDRIKIEKITKQYFDQKYAKELGTQLLIYSGAGGTGKTVKLLQLAHYAYQTLGKRVLILTYNLSLVSDIRRLFSIMGIVDDIACAQVRITSVHSFMYSILCSTGIFKRGDEEFLQRYESLKNDLLTVVDAVSDSDIEPWDFIMVDEGQDWPENERDIIYKLYKPQNVVVADGKSQLVRTNSHCDWAMNWKNYKVNLYKSLRLKHDICRFSENLIEQLGIPDWRMEPDVSIHGGRVFLVIGDLMKDQELVTRLIDEGIGDKNSHVDLLFCVPPSMVLRNPDGTKQSAITHQLNAMGYKTWDGVDEDNRQTFPTELEQLRIVQYDSCRGLEGWTVFNLAFEELYDYKKESYKASQLESTDMYFNEDEFSERFARRWLAIPITRAIDTLVINIRNPNHWLKEEMLKAAKSLSCVEVIHINDE